MGTFAGLFERGDKGIQSDKASEFAERVKIVYQNGGMMDIERMQLFGKKIATIHKAEMDSDGMDFYYNYFEDTGWENAGFSKKSNHVWSNKIGWAQFHRAVVAAYVLEEQYVDDVAVATVDGDPVTSWMYVGWLNYLFDEKKHVKNFDTWNLFEAFYYLDDRYDRWDDWGKWNDFGNKRYAFISGCEICSVIYGTDKALEIFETVKEEELEKLAYAGMKGMKEYLQEFAKEEQNHDAKQCQEMMDVIRQYYTKEASEENESLYEGKYQTIVTCLTVSDAPAFIVKGIAEIFQKDFRELWDEIKDIAERKQQAVYGNDEYYVVPISTDKFFRQAPDDMIYYWEDNDKIVFSDELWDWFSSLRKEYDIMMEDENIIEHPLHYIVDLMAEADENYYNIFAFTEFVEESIEKLSDKRYQVLWRLFDRMIHDSELKKAGDVIFVPEGPGHENEGIHYWGEQPKRRLISSWDFMEHSKKNNKGRVTLKRYMALVANKALRLKVFGF